MTVTLDSLARGCHDILATDNTPAGRARVAALLAQALQDASFLRSVFAGGVPPRKVIYRDPQLGFALLAHEHHGNHVGTPHDHGPSWAIYGQAEGETVMTDFERLAPAVDGCPGKARPTRSYALRPGDVHVYNEGDIHAPDCEGLSRLVRIEGTDLKTV